MCVRVNVRKTHEGILTHLLVPSGYKRPPVRVFVFRFRALTRRLREARCVVERMPRVCVDLGLALDQSHNHRTHRVVETTLAHDFVGAVARGAVKCGLEVQARRTLLLLLLLLLGCCPRGRRSGWRVGVCGGALKEGFWGGTQRTVCLITFSFFFFHNKKIRMRFDCRAPTYPAVVDVGPRSKEREHHHLAVRDRLRLGIELLARFKQRRHSLVALEMHAYRLVNLFVWF